MKQIQTPETYILKILGKQNVDISIEYRFISFCLKLEVNEGILLFNNLTKEFLILNKDEFNLLENSNFSKPADISKMLIENWFLVPVANDDSIICEQVRKIATLLKKTDGITHYNILPTTACNARCFYCFEAGAIPVVMVEKTALDVAEYIIKKSNGKRIAITWFGGEPLCNYPAITLISKKLAENNIKYSSRIVSNGYLFNQKIVDDAKNIWQLKKANITLDGMPETYRKVKAFVNNDPNPFERVINNIELLCEQNIEVVIRFNIDKHNFHELCDLVDLLYDRLKKYANDLICINPVPLYAGDSFNIKVRDELERNILVKQLLEIKKHIKTKGFKGAKVDINRFATNACLADDKNANLILPDGSLGFCEHNVSNDFYGTIYDDKEKPFWCNYIKHIPECKTCAYLPNCLHLEKCPNANSGCYEHNRIIRIDSLKNGMISVYNSFLQKN